MASEVTRVHNFEVRVVGPLDQVVAVVSHHRCIAVYLSRLQVHLVIALDPDVGGSSLLIKLVLHELLLSTYHLLVL